MLLQSTRDLVALAQTGTGKTAAYGLPLLQMTDQGDSATQALILCPTRELCLQITKDLTAYARHVREPNRANSIVLTLASDSLDVQHTITSAVEQQFDRADIEVVSTFLVKDERQEIDAAFGILVVLLMIMTVILASVGGLGLMGTMSLNVIERTREIGVMRAYGASSAGIFRIVIIEGLLIGMMSWVLAIGLSIPISIVLARRVGESFMSYPMPVSYSISGIFGWAALVIVISIIASFLPALRAVRLTVTQVLAYE